jgi:hypothetical protein
MEKSFNPYLRIRNLSSEKNASNFNILLAVVFITGVITLGYSLNALTYG